MKFRSVFYTMDRHRIPRAPNYNTSILELFESEKLPDGTFRYRVLEVQFQNCEMDTDWFRPGGKFHVEITKPHPKFGLDLEAIVRDHLLNQDSGRGRYYNTEDAVRKEESDRMGIDLLIRPEEQAVRAEFLELEQQGVDLQEVLANMRQLRRRREPEEDPGNGIGSGRKKVATHV